MNIPAEVIPFTLYLLLWCLAMLRNLEYQKVPQLMQQDAAPQEPESLPPISVIIVCHEQCEALRRHLPLVLEQEFPSPFEVIVADLNSTDETPLLLEKLQEQYLNLHVIRTPESARNVSPIRLAITLAMRSASHEWVVLTHADCQPASPHWLTHMAQACVRKPETQMVVGLTQLTHLRGWRGLCCRFLQGWQQVMHLPWAKRHGAYRLLGANLCYRRSLFFEHRGFAEHANLLTGACDIMVNQHSTARNTVLCLHPQALLLQEVTDSARHWSQERLFFMETRRHFPHRLSYRIRYARHVLLTWFFTLSTALLICLCTAHQRYVLLALAVLLWAAHAWRRALHFRSAMEALGQRPFPVALPLLLHLVAWWDIQAWVKWRLTNPRTFQKKPL